VEVLSVVSHNLSDVVHSSKITTREVEFEFREVKKSHGLSVGASVGGVATVLPYSSHTFSLITFRHASAIRVLIQKFIMS
jgi:hypothetical protein